jgi:hypothetical protein
LVSEQFISILKEKNVYYELQFWTSFSFSFSFWLLKMRSYGFNMKFLSISSTQLRYLSLDRLFYLLLLDLFDIFSRSFRYFFSLLVWPIVCDLSIHEYRGENNTLFARCFLTWRVNRINDKWQLDSFHLSKSFKGKGNSIYYRHSLCKYTGTFLL